MFGNDNPGNNQAGGFNNVSLPGNPGGAGPSQFNDPNPPAGAPMDPPANLANDFSQQFPNTPAGQVQPAAGDLMDIKRQALSQLSPLIGQLDQTPEEKFRTTMMMIQASDNQYLLKDAYSAAQAIPDTKARAQALLDVINEINYFSQKNQGQVG